VSTSLEYLRRVGAETRGDKDLALDIGSAYLQLARGPGPFRSTPTLGSSRQAEESLRKAVLVSRFRGFEQDPGNRVALLTSASASHDHMALLGVQERFPESLDQARKTAAQLESAQREANWNQRKSKEVAFYV